MNFLCLDFRPFGSRPLKTEISISGTTAPFIVRRINENKLNIEDSLFKPAQEKFLKFTGKVFLLFSKSEELSLCDDFLHRFQVAFEDEGKQFMTCLEDELPPEAFEDEMETATHSVKIFKMPSQLMPSFILENIYIGDMNHAKSLETLNKLGITHIINVSKDVPCYYEDVFQYFRVPIDDTLTENVCLYLKDAIHFILKAKDDAKIFVHCAAGISRSPAIVIGYVMWKQKTSFDDAFLIVHAHRSVIDPNFAFCSQLTMQQGQIHSYDF